jgi:hypothetical protein
MYLRERMVCMHRLIYVTAVTLLFAGSLLTSCDNLGDDPRSEADKRAGRTLEAPGDSVRLEDTLSNPPPSKDTVQR